MLRYTGGQAAIIVRQHADKDDGAKRIIRGIVAHYESTSNKATAITHILGELGKMKYTNRSDIHLTKHLTQFQNHVQDLADCQHTGLSDLQIKSMLLNSITHSAYTSLIDGYLHDNTSWSQIVTDLSQKSE